MRAPHDRWQLLQQRAEPGCELQLHYSHEYLPWLIQGAAEMSAAPSQVAYAPQSVCAWHSICPGGAARALPMLAAIVVERRGRMYTAQWVLSEKS